MDFLISKVRSFPQHEITVKKKGFAEWNRKLNVTGGSIHLTADLEANAATTATPATAKRSAAGTSVPTGR